MTETVLITGASGLVGRHLSALLTQEGYLVRTLSRDPAGPSHFHWDPAKGTMDAEALSGADHIVHLAGTGIGDKAWSEKRKAEILQSRVCGTELLFQTCRSIGMLPKTFLTASAVGYYGSAPSGKRFTESDGAGQGFLASVCEQWERAALLFEEAGVRTVRMRTGLVLANNGGILPQTALPVRMGLGTAFGNGKQVLPWIHLYDLGQLYLEALRQSTWSGAFNAVAPKPVNNKVFTKELARLFHKPFWPVSVPGFLVKALLGERSELLLQGNDVRSERLSELTFNFRFETLEKALQDLYPNG
jgi:uncharacterized protein (TIGR01777 family)